MPVPKAVPKGAVQGDGGGKGGWGLNPRGSGWLWRHKKNKEPPTFAFEARVGGDETRGHLQSRTTP
jgi:hypothetical protein